MDQRKMSDDPIYQGLIYMVVVPAKLTSLEQKF